MNNLEMALAYLRKGISVIPLYSPAMLKKYPPSSYLEAQKRKIENNDSLSPEELELELLVEYCKRPLVAWSEYQKRLPKEEEVMAWFTRFPEANIGIVTGKISNLVVFDLYSEEAREYVEKAGGFPKTPRVKTGKGEHVYFKHPGFEVKNRVNKKLAFDIRGDGGFVVAPPSFHGSGLKYEWIQGCSLLEIDPAQCSSWMVDYLRSASERDEKARDEMITEGNNKKGKEKESTKDKHTEIDGRALKGNRYLNILRDGCAEGERNETATKLIGHFLRKGLDPEEVWELVKLWNKKNRPPLDEKELRRTLASVRREEEKSQEHIDIADFRYEEAKIAAEFSGKYYRVPFAGPNLSFLEKIMNGGLAGRRVYILGGVPSSGKTALLNNMADNICLNGYPVLFFSYDDGRLELFFRTLARFSQYEIQVFNRGILIESDLLAELSSIPEIKQILELKYVVENMVFIEEWDGIIEKIREKHGKPPVIFIDYLRKLKTKKAFGDERLRVDELISKLTELAKGFNLPIMVVSELARDAYKTGQKLSLASFKESGSIEYEASWLGILTGGEEPNGEFPSVEELEKYIGDSSNGTELPIDLLVFKAKRGTGFIGKALLKLDKNKMRVADRAVINTIVPTSKILTKIHYPRKRKSRFAREEVIYE